MQKKLPELNGGDLVLIEWLDAVGHRDRDKADPIPCLSVGWIVEVGEKNGGQFIKLASELMTDGDEFDTQEHVSIPEGMVKRITVVTRRKLPKPFDEWAP